MSDGAPVDTLQPGQPQSPPDAGPAPAGTDGFRLAGRVPPVMRLSRKALAGFAIVAAAAIGGSLLFALQPRTAAVADNLYDGDAVNRSETITGAPADYAAIPKLGPPLPGDLGGPILSAQQEGAYVPVPPIAAAPPAAMPADRAPDAAEQARERLQQERNGARLSQLFASSATAAAEPGGAAAAAVPDAPSPAAGRGDAAGEARPAGRTTFLDAAASGPPASAHRLVAAASPYMVQAGSVIPAALITGIRSDLPGQITAQVTQNVHDSATGRIVLIPQGARLIGQYDSAVVAGQNRVLLAWDRLLLPDGRSIALDRLPGADAAGMAGLGDRTDYHWGGMLRAALVSALLGVGSELAIADDSALVRALRTGTQDSVAETGRQLVERQLARAPTLTIRPGFSLRVIVTRDLVLEPLRALP